ncbi:O-sialoglycoprotein endopeptidase [Anseongella ginsenosidimutans]|uniref:tRNA N6-adenosine threonylcarbamoyltransferase n=1 Tax=Anseongella ginsenosidimutans TaxID=496056 RepID=A0A4R3KY78_9SPHI|nr:tRNA (adenosine(37)-N6)-threonylcarbamoyltransferase complex transferase subunit TsaD [Anseongella ginsenosidimutans]QEC51095.1 tRNA (adenosine(37)-N6)-threonylcarbamoyltransferase complex transferase subunit TsaD [Anseongella ginsenosidimutans]TCS90244.1 O-sialoglycoprotein endopeptidase [Anseongella ginsenosidimutans]
MCVILGIESSCDETSVAVCDNGSILSNIIAGQHVHEAYGGVVPELASRAHQQNIIPAVHQAIKKAKISKKDINAVAFTRGPGLLGSLLVGTSFAKAFALGLKVPLIEVNHMQAHILAHFIDEPRPAFPFLCLTVSGGHTQIVKVNDYFEMELLGQTLDDAAGEAFDKTAKILGLPYPGGPLVDRYAREGNPDAFKFPEPSVPGLDFSFSGLKTSILYFVRDHIHKNPSFLEENMADICASVQSRIVSILLNKLKKASGETGITQVAIAGGVSANSGLRDAVQEAGKALGWEIFIPRLEYCTDNAAMIAIAAYYKYLKGDFAGQDVSPLARWSL